jgi:hypothetical protein
MSRRTPSHPEIVTGAHRSLTPDEQPAVSGRGVAGPPAWFIALQNLKGEVLGELVKHEAKDAERHEEQNKRLDRLDAKVGLLGLIGGALGSAGPQIFEWLTR